jgi:hypothetical protein
MFEYMKSRVPDLNYPKPSGMSWMRFQMKDTHANLSYAPSRKTLYVYLLFKGDDPVDWFKFAKEKIELDLELEWIERGVDSYAQWATDFDHQDISNDKLTFDKVGKVLSEIQKEIASTHDRFMNQ